MTVRFPTPGSSPATDGGAAESRGAGSVLDTAALGTPALRGPVAAPEVADPAALDQRFASPRALEDAAGLLAEGFLAGEAVDFEEWADRVRRTGLDPRDPGVLWDVSLRTLEQVLALSPVVQMPGLLDDALRALADLLDDLGSYLCRFLAVVAPGLMVPPSSLSGSGAGGAAPSLGEARLASSTWADSPLRQPWEAFTRGGGLTRPLANAVPGLAPVGWILGPDREEVAAFLGGVVTGVAESVSLGDARGLALDLQHHLRHTHVFTALIFTLGTLHGLVVAPLSGLVRLAALMVDPESWMTVLGTLADPAQRQRFVAQVRSLGAAIHALLSDPEAAFRLGRAAGAAAARGLVDRAHTTPPCAFLFQAGALIGPLLIDLALFLTGVGATVTAARRGAVAVRGGAAGYETVRVLQRAMVSSGTLVDTAGEVPTTLRYLAVAWEAVVEVEQRFPQGLRRLRLAERGAAVFLWVDRAATLRSMVPLGARAQAGLDALAPHQDLLADLLGVMVESTDELVRMERLLGDELGLHLEVLGVDYRRVLAGENVVDLLIRHNALDAAAAADARELAGALAGSASQVAWSQQVVDKVLTFLGDTPDLAEVVAGIQHFQRILHAGNHSLPLEGPADILGSSSSKRIKILSWIDVIDEAFAVDAATGAGEEVVRDLFRILAVLDGRVDDSIHEVVRDLFGGGAGSSGAFGQLFAARDLARLRPGAQMSFERWAWSGAGWRRLDVVLREGGRVVLEVEVKNITRLHDGIRGQMIRDLLRLLERGDLELDTLLWMIPEARSAQLLEPMRDELRAALASPEVQAGLRAVFDASDPDELARRLGVAQVRDADELAAAVEDLLEQRLQSREILDTFGGGSSADSPELLQLAETFDAEAAQLEAELSRAAGEAAPR